MSTKSDRDNRANQLNPNNFAYHSSRQSLINSDCDEEDEGSCYRSATPAPASGPSLDCRINMMSEQGHCVLLRIGLHTTSGLPNEGLSDALYTLCDQLLETADRVWNTPLAYLLVLKGETVYRLHMHPRPLADAAVEAALTDLCDTPDANVARKDLGRVFVDKYRRDDFHLPQGQVESLFRAAAVD